MLFYNSIKARTSDLKFSYKVSYKEVTSKMCVHPLRKPTKTKSCKKIKLFMHICVINSNYYY